METNRYTTSMGIQPTACVRTVRIRYSLPIEHPSTGGKDDGARGLCEYPIEATQAIKGQSGQNTHENRANSLLIRVYCNRTGSRPAQAESPAQEDEPTKEEHIECVPSCHSKRRDLYQRLVGSANPSKEYHH